MTKCRVCEDELTDENWYLSYQERKQRICKACVAKKNRKWGRDNPDKRRLLNIKSDEARSARRRRAGISYKDNHQCAQFLGVHVAERVLSHVFKDVKRMPFNNSGFDFICNHGKKIDVKSSCIRERYGNWSFNIKHNTTADYFLCMAFDNREALTPLHAWLLPGSEVNHLMTVDIYQNTAHKWDEYKLDIEKVSVCCDVIRGEYKA